MDTNSLLALLKRRKQTHFSVPIGLTSQVSLCLGAKLNGNRYADTYLMPCGYKSNLFGLTGLGGNPFAWFSNLTMAPIERIIGYVKDGQQTVTPGKFIFEKTTDLGIGPFKNIMSGQYFERVNDKYMVIPMKKYYNSHDWMVMGLFGSPMEPYGNNVPDIEAYFSMYYRKFDGRWKWVPTT